MKIIFHYSRVNEFEIRTIITMYIFMYYQNVECLNLRKETKLYSKINQTNSPKVI